MAPSRLWTVTQPRCRPSDFSTAIEYSGRRGPALVPSLPILHLSSYFIAVTKPADMRMDGKLFSPTVEQTVQRMIHEALEHDADCCRPKGMRRVGHAWVPLPPPRVRMIHQLDYATSGVLLMGLQREPTARACAAFQNRTVGKTYVALVHGLMLDGKVGTTTRLDWPLCERDDDFKVRVDCDGVALDNDTVVRTAVTRCRVLAVGTFCGVPATQLFLEPETGRRHQLRVHLRTAGHGIIGDATYATYDDETERFPRMMLHAWRLCMPPSVTEPYQLPDELIAPIPSAFDDFVSSSGSALCSSSLKR